MPRSYLALPQLLTDSFPDNDLAVILLCNRDDQAEIKQVCHEEDCGRCFRLEGGLCRAQCCVLHVISSLVDTHSVSDVTTSAPHLAGPEHDRSITADSICPVQLDAPLP
jgi:hypothetical protein